MAFKKIPLTIDTMIRNPVPVEGINQEDNVELNIVVTENKTPKDLSSQTIKVYVRRIDGTLVEQTNQITLTNARKGEVTVKLKNSAFNKEGYALFQLDVSDSIGRITSSYATFKIGKGLVSGEAIANTNEVEALKKIEEYVKKVNLEFPKYENKINEFNQKTEEYKNEVVEYQGEVKKFQNIANSLQTQFDEAVANITNGVESATNSEIVQARGGEVNLNRRLDKFDSQLDNKTSKEETKNIQTQVNNLVLQAGNPDASSAEIFQARGEYKVLNDRIRASENIPFYLQKEIKHEEVSIKTFQPNTWNNTSANFVGFAILFKAPQMVEKTKGFILSDNDGIAYCQLADERGNEIATSSASVSANATDYTTFDFGLLDTSMYSNIWVRFYGDGTLVPRRCTTWKNHYFDKTHIPNVEKCVAYKQGNSWIPHNDYNYSIPTEFVSSFFGKRVNNIHVGNEAYQFTSLKTAIESINDSNENNIYNVYIHNDIDLYSEFGGDDFFNGLSQTDGFMQGLMLPNYVNLIGVGDVSITFNAPDTLATSTNVPCVSTLNLMYNNEIENIKFYGKNVRYVIHDETNNTFHNLIRKFKNCYFEHLGNKGGTWASMHTLGCGCGSNCYYEYDNCKMINTVAPYLMHNNTNQKSSRLVFNNCEIIGWKDKGCVSLSGLSGTTEPCYAIFNNCKLSGWITTTRDIWNVSGGGNTEIPYMMNQSQDNKIRVLFNDEIKTIRNIASSTIAKFTPLMIDGGFLNKIPSGQEYRFYGIALEKTTGGNITTVKYRGYIDITSLNIATADGDKIGIVDGVLAKVTGSDFIGVVSKQDSSYFLRLK